MDASGGAAMDCDGLAVETGGANSVAAVKGLLDCTECGHRIRGKHLLDKRKTDGGYAHRVCLKDKAAAAAKQREKRALMLAVPGEVTPRQQPTRAATAAPSTLAALADAAIAESNTDSGWDPTPEELAA